jgi:hypothetical protein
MEIKILDLFDTPVSNKTYQKKLSKIIQNPLKFEKTDQKNEQNKNPYRGKKKS